MDPVLIIGIVIGVIVVGLIIFTFTGNDKDETSYDPDPTAPEPTDEEFENEFWAAPESAVVSDTDEQDTIPPTADRGEFVNVDTLGSEPTVDPVLTEPTVDRTYPQGPADPGVIDDNYNTDPQTS